MSSDLSSRRYHVYLTGGESFIGAAEASDNTILWGELFRDKERSFLRSVLEEKTMGFGTRDSFQIAMRVAWQPEVKKEVEKTGRTGTGRLVMMVHGYSGRTTSSWAWIKMVQPLWKQGYTVCCVDMPGLGRSSMNLKWNTPVEAWKRMDGSILGTCISGLGFQDNVSFIAYGEGCSSVARCWRSFPHLISGRNVFVDPIFTFDDLAPLPVPYGAPEDWLKHKEGNQIMQFEKFLLKARMSFWTCFTGAPGVDGARHALKAMLKKSKVTGSKLITISELSKDFICEAQAGSASPAVMLVPCKYIKYAFAHYLAGRMEAPDEIPSWALDVASTAASSVSHSKSVPPSTGLETPAVANGDWALWTVREAAEVLSRQGERPTNRPSSRASSQEGEIPANRPTSRAASQEEALKLPRRRRSRAERHESQGLQMRGKPSLPSLMGTSSSTGLGNEGDGGRSAGSRLLNQLAMTGGFGDSRSRFGSKLSAGRGILKNKSRSVSKIDEEPRFAETGGFSRGSASPPPDMSPAGRASLPSLSRPSSKGTAATQRSAKGVEICRPWQMPPPGFKTEAAKWSIFKCAKEATKKRGEDTRTSREKVVSNNKQVKETKMRTEMMPSLKEPIDVKALLAHYQEAIR